MDLKKWLPFFVLGPGLNFCKDITDFFRIKPRSPSGDKMTKTNFVF